MTSNDSRYPRRACRPSERAGTRATSNLDRCAAEWCRLYADDRAAGQDQRDDLDVKETLYCGSVDVRDDVTSS